jgi:hypothetical protein
MASYSKRTALMTWALANGLMEAAADLRTTAFKSAVDDLKPFVTIDEDKSVIKIRKDTIDFLAIVFENGEVITYEKQQSYLHMLAVLVEFVINTDANIKRKGYWINLQNTLVDLINYLDDDTGDHGVETGCAWADKLLNEIWN